MAEQANESRKTWHHAQRLRKVLLKELEKLKNDQEVNNLAQFGTLERIMADFRLACVSTIFLDFEYATSEKVGIALWQAHSLVNSEYRKSIARLKVSQLAVQKRKVDKMYSNFLKTAQYFYKGYIQRLTARYNVPELHRIAEGIKAEKLTDAETIDNVSATLREIIVKSCHATLIHLGDLSRYRTQSRQKVPDYETGLTYYSLAHDLIPSSGHAHHQMGIVYLDEKRHLDIIYHFYRALAIEQPHPNALQNLEAEFKALQLPSTPARRTAPPDPQEAFMIWFVRLQAHIFKGEPFPQHRELENEVLSRLETAIKSPSNIGLLLKMVLVNFSAYYVASMRLNDKWTMSASRSTHFILRLSSRFLTTLCRHAQKELERLLEQKSQSIRDGEKTPKPSDGKAAEMMTTTLENLLPLLRLYASWLVSCRAEVVAAEDALEPFMKDMFRTYARLLSLFCELFAGEDLKVAPYLLAEDQEALGLLPLNNPQLPTGCRLDIDEETKTVKPQVDYFVGQRYDTYGEMLCRILDIIQCGFFLANDEKFPFSFAQGPKGLTFNYEEEDGSVERTLDSVINQQNSDAAGTSASRRVDSSSQELGFQQRDPLSAPKFSGMHNEHQKKPNSLSSSHASERGSRADQRAARPTKEITAQGSHEAEFSVDSDMLQMVNEFLLPPDSNEFTVRNPDDTSYGMHSTTANEVFGVFQASSPPAVGSATSKTFPSLPWEMIYTPTPHRGKSKELTPPRDLAMRGIVSERLSYPVSGKSVTTSSTVLLDDPFGAGSELASAAPAIPFAGNTTPDNAAAAHRNRLLQAFTGPKSRTARHTCQEDSAACRAWPKEPLDYSIDATSSTPSQGQGYQATYFNEESAHGTIFEAGNGPSSSMVFSHPSSVYESTPCNGMAYNASTAFGRGSITGMNDPSHYRNKVLNSEGAATDNFATEYNSSVLRAALTGDTRQVQR